jgi:hypothetical protein
MTDENFGGAAMAENDDWRNRYEESKREQIKYRVWWVINPPNKPVFTTVATLKQGKKLIDDETHRQLKNSRIYANAFGLESYDEEFGWTEWYDDNGCCILDEDVDLSE